jgi:hypothetical protein
VGADVPLSGGKFTMTLAAPPAAYFYDAEVEDYDRIAPAPMEDAPNGPKGPSSASDGADGTGGSIGTRSITPRGGTIGGGLAVPLSVAVAGFVAYVDTNGNGQLDITAPYGTSTDQILGGNDELFIAYLRGGGALDYEKLRDKSGIAPNAGYNLAWDEGRWLPLSMVELKISPRNKRLPRNVCSSSSGTSGYGGVSTAPSVDPEPTPAPTTSRSGYPDPSEVNCSSDGRSWSYKKQPDCQLPPPPPAGLCGSSYGYDEPAIACAGITGSSLASNAPIPEGWPCTVPPALDGGAAPDATPPPDASADAGAD